VEADELSDVAGLFIEAVAEALHNTLDDDLSIGGEGDTEDDVAFDMELASLGGVLRRRLGDDFDGDGHRSCLLLLDGSGCDLVRDAG
jgi:hypothetical protein